MDNLTHSLVGAVLGQAGLKKKTGLAMPALIIGANIPDVDATCFLWLEGMEHVGFRRGITHGPPAMILLPLVLAGALWWFDRWQTKRGKRPEGRLPVHFRWLYALSLLGCLTHPAMDWLNVYGVRFLEPFSSVWSYGDTLFIIDVWLWAMLIGSVWWSWRREKRGGNWTRPARIGIVVALAYIGVNWAITTARELRDSDVIAPGRVVIASPVPLAFWDRETIIGESGRYAIYAPGIEYLDHDQAAPDDYRPYFQMVGECDLGPAFASRNGNSELDAFLFWSRAPFAVRADDGSMILYDARFYDPRARDRFSVALPDVPCEPLVNQ